MFLLQSFREDPIQITHKHLQTTEPSNDIIKNEPCHHLGCTILN
jgi:hypothetical protein